MKTEKRPDKKLYIDLSRPPKVLLLGNGVLQLNNGMKWSELIAAISPSDVPERKMEGIPYAMQPEAACGTDVEEVQRKTAEAIRTAVPHEMLQQLTDLRFDAILTTNYTYEIEETLTGKHWSESRRRKSHTTLYGSPHVRYNTYKCNVVKDRNGREIPVFHVHGEKERKHSLVLSYYSYASSVYRLIDMNKRRQNTYEEKQQEEGLLECQGWLDYFLLGDVYAVGFGFDLSEFDIWWAMERKSREHADHGRLHAYMIGEKQDAAKSTMFEAMDVEEKYYRVEMGNYLSAYERMLIDLKKDLG